MITRRIAMADYRAWPALGAGLLLAGCFLSWPAAAQERDRSSLTVGSKKFTESVILGEVLGHVLRQAGYEAHHRSELGGTQVLWNALQRGDIDAYVEYTGTLREEILAGRDLGKNGMSEAVVRALADAGVVATRPLGFNNTYALGMLEATAQTHDVQRISDLQHHPQLVFGFTNEFLDRGDGWPNLRQHYRLPQTNVRGLDHDLAYRGLADGRINVVDLYSTDAEIAYYGLRVLADDLHYFPTYEALVLHRRDLPASAVTALRQLAGTIDAPAMVAMNAAVKLDRQQESVVAAGFVRDVLALYATATTQSRWSRLIRRTREHLLLVGLSLMAAIVVAIPLGVAAARGPRLGQAILAATGMLQTIPSLALLVFMIPLLGIGAPPALMALFLYSLLPIVRNTHAGLRGIAPETLESADALGITPRARLRLIELPLAAPAILAGIKTSAVINIGTATLGAVIGAGGYGQPILTGIRLDDLSLILEGAVPAAGMALLAQGAFELAERWLVPRGLRL